MPVDAHLLHTYFRFIVLADAALPLRNITGYCMPSKMHPLSRTLAVIAFSVFCTPCYADEGFFEKAARLYAISDSFLLSESHPTAQIGYIQYVFTCYRLLFDNEHIYLSIFSGPRAHCSTPDRPADCSSSNTEGDTGWHKTDNTLDFTTSLDLSCYRQSWLSFIEQYIPLRDAVLLILPQFYDLERRLNKLEAHKAGLKAKYDLYFDDDEYLQPVQEDIRRLSTLAQSLSATTIRFFDAIKPEVIKAEMWTDRMRGRMEAMEGLRTFETRLADIQSQPTDAVPASLEAIVVKVNNAVRELEDALAQ